MPPTDTAADDAVRDGCDGGRVRRSLSAPPLPVVHCRRTRCPRRTGTVASSSAEIVPGALTFTCGEDILRARAPESGWSRWLRVGCGSGVPPRDPDDPDLVTLRPGGFDTDPGARPHQFDDAASWGPVAGDGLPRYPGVRPE